MTNRTDIFERSIGKVLDRMKPTQMTINVVTGRTADAVGSIVLVEVAKRTGSLLVVKGKSEFHGGKLFGKVKP